MKVENIKKCSVMKLNKEMLKSNKLNKGQKNQIYLKVESQEDLNNQSDNKIYDEKSFNCVSISNTYQEDKE